MKSALIFLTFLGTMSAAAQQPRAHTPKSIAVTATEKVSADPDRADLAIGHIAYGRTQEEAYLASKKAAEAILSALSSAKVEKTAIETADLHVERVESDSRWSEAEKSQRQFFARQSWTVHVSAEQAQGVLDAAIGAGANNVSSPTWFVADRAALQARAAAAALMKARKVAEQMASGLGVKLGSVLYASNQPPDEGGAMGGVFGNAVVAPPPSPKPPQLKLFPAKVTEEATVYAEFAIE